MRAQRRLTTRRLYSLIGTLAYLVGCASSDRVVRLTAQDLRGGDVDRFGGLRVRLWEPSASFQVKKVGNRWVLVTPEGSPFWMLGIWNITGDGRVDELGSSYTSRFLRKYGSDQAGWPQVNRRLKSWGFNTIGPYSYRMLLPTNRESPTVWPPDGTHPVKMPFVGLGPNPGISSNLAGVCKNLWKGIDPSVFNIGSARGFPDVIDPKFVTYTNNAYATDSDLAVYKDSPYFIGYFSEDVDYLSGFATGTDFPSDPPGKEWAHLGVITLITAPTQSGFSDPKVYSKYALRDFLAAKYGTIGALNSAWGSNYTTFDSSGGWPTGSGLLDENGRSSHRWLGNPLNPELLTGMNAQVKADLDEFLYQLAAKYFSINRAAFKAVAPQALFLGPTSLGGAGWRSPARGPILKAAGQYLDVVSVSTDGSPAQLDFIAHWAGDVPLIIWEGVVANPDSGRWRYTPEPATWAVSTQEKRGQTYQRDVEALVNGTVTGTRPYVGLLFWSWVDHSAEQKNWGLVSLLDNAYDGKEARVAAGKDPWGYPTGGEERDYGDFISYVRNANLAVLRTLRAELAPWVHIERSDDRERIPVSPRPGRAR